MTDSEKKMLRTFITQRQEIVFNRLNENLRYQEICDRQKRTEAGADEILHKLEKDERISVRRYYEGETEKTGIELNEVYIQGFVKKTFASAGMCADVCVHDKGDGNPHAHVMLTLRPIEPDGRWGAKSKKEYVLDDNGERVLPSGEYRSRKVYTVDWNEPTKAEDWRAAWAEAANSALSLHGIIETLDHRSYERQGVDKQPSVHLGSAASQMESKGIATDRGDINRRVEVNNKQLSQQRARIKKAKDWLYAVPIQDNAPTMIEVMNRIADAKNLDRQWKKLRRLKT